jgi:Flp pilus assembly protein TadG
MRNRRSQHGGTLVEGALTLIVLLAFLFAILELGRAYNVYQVMTNAAREGARFSVAPCSATDSSCPYPAGTLPTTGDVQTYVTRYLNTAAVQGATVTVVQDASRTINSVPQTFTQVTVSAPYSFIFFHWTITMTTEAVMRNENQ